MAAAFDFSELSPDLILDACQHYGFYAESGLLALNSYENRVYQFKADDQQRYVVKIYRPQRWSTAQIQEEHQFAFELAAAEIPVVAPLCRDGQSVLPYQGYQRRQDSFLLYSNYTNHLHHYPKSQLLA